MSCAIALVALSLGYFVFLYASREKEGVRLLGQVIGILVMIAAVMCLLCSAGKCMSRSKCHQGSKECPMMGSSKAPMCSIKDKAPEPDLSE